jgi:Tol biopolymer transport system component
MDSMKISRQNVPLALAAFGLALSAPSWLAAQTPAGLRDPREAHLAEVRQLTFGGENAEGYWSADGRELILQSTNGDLKCDQIFRLAIASPGALRRVSTGAGRTTCAYFFPAGNRILYSSTHKADPACPPTPDHSRGYVWPIYPEYEIWSANLDGGDLVALTQNDAYDAEATTCPRDGSIVFTSDRDGDLELYRMDADGKNVKRLTRAAGYDGGAFFSPDCTKIVWRASRPAAGADLEDYQALLGQHLVRPSRLELMVANADGTDARQITYLGAASFAPSFFPSGERIIFSSNTGDAKGREFDLWAVNLDGSELERVTYTPGFDGFPVFSPDGKTLAFASNRNQGKHGETDLYIARWQEAAVAPVENPADGYAADVRWLADDARGGRGLGTPGLTAAAEYIEGRMRSLGLEPGADGGGFRQAFEVAVAVTSLPGTALEIGGDAVAREDFGPASFSLSGTAQGETVAAGYGISAPELGRDDYAGKNVRGKIAVVRRFVPSVEAFKPEDVQRRYGDLRYKAWNAREHGALGLIVVDFPELAAGEAEPEEAPLPVLRVDREGDAGIPVVYVKRAQGKLLFAGATTARLTVDLAVERAPAWNLIGRLPAGAADKLPGAVVVGAHYDHLGLGGPSSLAPDSREPHNGADDNASGVAGLLEAARVLAARRGELRRDVWFVAFSGEEEGALGSTAFTRRPPASLPLAEVLAMVNMDMIGRLREDRVSILGGESAAEWRQAVPGLCAQLGIECALSGDGYGPSDQTPFFAAGVPVLHLFTGAHSDYHKPSDDAARINAAGGARVARLAAEIAAMVAARDRALTYVAAAAPAPRGDVRGAGASLGTVPDYAGPADGRPGVLLAGVRPGGPAEKGGLRRGDLLVELAGHPIRDIQDFMFALRAAKSGQEAVAVVEREGRRLDLLVTFGVATGMR